MSSEVEPLLENCKSCNAVLDVSEQEPFADIQCPTCNARMRVRTRFDHFELIEAIASGGMGTVYKAKDINLDRIVALKLLRKEFSDDEEYIEKLETEAKITASVNHPNVVKVFSFGCDQGLYYIAMELVDKGSLDDLMGLQTRIAEIQVLEIGIQVAQGLNAALQAGLIHRDVKPGNILFADARTAKIVDFGLAMPLEQARDAEGGEIWGTPYYVAPEKLNHEPEDFRSDIYSLGGTLFHALAGRPPFEADNASMVALKHLKSQVVSLQAFAPDISSPTAYVINRTLAKDPDERYQSYEELVEHLEYARNTLQETTSKPRQAKTRVVMEGEEQQRLLGYILMGVIAVTVILGGVFFFFKDNLHTRGQSVADRERARLLQAASADETYTIARKMITDGDAEGAVPIFWLLGGRTNTSEPLKSWVIIQGGISAYLSDLPTLARESFERLRTAGEWEGRPEDRPIADFFLALGSLMTSDSPVTLENLREYENARDYRAIALFALGLKEWNNGRFANASELFEAFNGVDFEQNARWLESYKPIAQRYVDDYTIAKELLSSNRNTSTPEERNALYSKVEMVRMNLMMRGKLAEHISGIERSLGFARPPEAGLGGANSKPPSINVIRDQALRMIRDFDPEQAKKQVDTASSSGGFLEAFNILSRQVGYVVDFKQQLIADLNSEGYTGNFKLKRGNEEITGKVTKASEFRLDLQTPQGSRSILWADLSEQSLIAMASSLIRARPGDPASENDLKRLWTLGAYAAMIGNRSEALPRLMRAAEKRDYARDLSLFDKPIRP